jgi:CRP/FNR family cyclic AMP-dependent transcriptional regulator
MSLTNTRQSRSAWGSIVSSTDRRCCIDQLNWEMASRIGVAEKEHVLFSTVALCALSYANSARSRPGGTLIMSATQQHETPVLSPPNFPSIAVVKRNIVEYTKGARIFAQGDASKHVLYVQQGGIRISVVNEGGKEAVIGILGPGDFCGENCMSGLPFRTSTATSIIATKVLAIEKKEMIRALRSEHTFSDRFMLYMLSRNIRVEEDLIDQLLNSTEKRLARTLLLLASYGKQGQPQKMLPKISQETLAEMIGTTRSRVNFFMNKFKKLGFIDYKGTIRINNSLLNVVLHD